MTIDGDENIAPLKSFLLRVHSSTDAANLNLGLFGPASGPDAVALIEFRRERDVELFAVAHEGYAQRVLGAGELLHQDVFPRRVGNTVDSHHLIAFLDTGFCGGRIR